MTWAGYGWLIAVAVNLLTAAYVYGKLTQSVSDHERRLGKTEVKLDDHETRITRLEPKTHLH